MHLLGSSVLTLMLLPLALPYESERSKRDIDGNYRNIISQRLEYTMNQLSTNCNFPQKNCKNISPVKERSITNHICKLNKQLQRQEKLLENISQQLKHSLEATVEEIETSLGCKKQSGQPEEKIKKRDRKCRVKQILDSIQRCFQLNSEITDH